MFGGKTVIWHFGRCLRRACPAARAKNTKQPGFVLDSSADFPSLPEENAAQSLASNLPFFRLLDMSRILSQYNKERV